MRRDDRGRHASADRLRGAARADRQGQVAPDRRPSAARGRRVPTAAPGTTPIGRRREQRVLRRAIEQVAAGGGRAVAIQGEPGLGKSRLLAEAAGLAAARGLRCLSGAGDVIEHATPYHGWRPVIAALLGVDDGAPDAERQRVLEAALGPRAPLLNTVLGVDLPDSEATAQLQQERRIQATRQLLLELLGDAAAQPLMIAIDDAHWLDSASWTLLREVVRGGLPALTLVGSRPTATPEYAQMLAAPSADLVELAPLADEDALELACDLLDAVALDPAVEALLLDRAAGSPLFVEEIARALTAAGLVELDDAGQCVVAAGADLRALALPGTVEGVIANRMEGLDPQVDLVLKVAGAIGQTFTAEMVRDVHPVTLDAGRIDACLEALVRRDLTQLIAPPPGATYAFRHALIREVAYGRLLFGQRRALHRAIGEWHEQRFADNLAPVYATLAHHFSEAGDVERACDYLGRASVQAANNGMSREAVDLGLAATHMLGVDLPRSLPEVQAAIGERLQAIAVLMGDRSIESLGELPPAADPARAAAIGILLQTAPAAFLSQQSELFALIGLEGFRLTLEAGSTPWTPGVFALYALLVRSFDADPRPAFALSTLAERLARRDSPPLRSYAGFVHAWFVRHWLEPIDDELPGSSSTRPPASSTAT